MANTITQQLHPGIVDIVLSCSVCQDTLSSIYASSVNDRGLRQGPDLKGGSINKLWLTECAHIVCGKHLEGGGVPFHAEHQQPRAPCPLCTTNNRDQSSKILYAIRGVSEGEYDSNIPPDYLQVPLSRLFGPGNEALRFQYVSLLRFAEKVHERLRTSEEELNTWKYRESSIVACLAAMEPLSRALHLARERLSEMRGDVSFIDDVLHLAANLRMNSIVPGDHEVVSMHDNKPTSLADAGTTAKSLLAQGTAVDLEMVQNNVAHLDKQHPVSLGQRLDSANERAIKRRRIGEIDSIEVEDGSNGQSLPQRLASRDAMPPPPGHFLNSMVRDPNPCFSFGQANGHKRTSTPAVSGHGHSPHPGGCEYRSPSTHLPSLQRLSMEPEQGSSDTLGSTASARSSLYWKQQESNGELDQSTSLPLLRGFSSHISPPRRLTLPPRTPLNTNQATSYGQVGILAHARTSQPYSQTPGDLRPFQRRHSGYATSENSQPAASPYFGSRPLITSLPAQNSYTNRPAFQAYQQTPSRTPSIKPALFSSHPTSNQLPWLTSSLRQGPNPNIKGASMAELQSGSDGHRQSTNSRHLTNQRFSLNSIPIIQQSQIDGGEGGQNAKVPSVNHGRRAARR